LIDRNLLIASLNAQVPARDYLASFVKSDRLLGAAIGLLYAVAGALILTMKKPAVTLALVLLILVIIGRVAMVVTGFYPIDSRPQLVAITLGTTIAAAFAIFIRLNWNIFE
jgi:hypothetical protein